MAFYQIAIWVCETGTPRYVLPIMNVLLLVSNYIV
jgi:hypothetical protein